MTRRYRNAAIITVLVYLVLPFVAVLARIEIALVEQIRWELAERKTRD